MDYALSRIDEIKSDVGLVKIEHMVNGLLAERMLGLTDLRANELKQVLAYVRRRIGNKPGQEK